MKRTTRQEALVLGAVGGIVVGSVTYLALTWLRGFGKDHVEAFVGFLGIVVAVAGWYQSTRLAHKTQRELLHLQLLNEARELIVRACRAEEDRLGSMSVQLGILEFSPDPVPPETRSRIAAALHAFNVDNRAVNWIFALEEHHALFPELRPARVQIVLRGRTMSEECRQLAMALTAAGMLPRFVLEQAARLQRNISEQQSLFHDLMIHVQGRAFGSVSGHAAKIRNPPDDSVVRLVERGDRVTVDVLDKAKRAQLEVGGWLPRAD